MLLALFVLAGSVGWGTLQLVEAWVGRLLPVPWTAAVTLWLLAVALLFWALLSRPRLLRKEGHRPMPPLVAARTAALAMAASRTGALVGGFYAGVLVGVLPYDSPAGRERLWSAGAAVLGALALTVVAVWLERLCRLPEDPDEAAAGRRADDLAGEGGGNGSWATPRSARPGSAGPGSAGPPSAAGRR